MSKLIDDIMSCDDIIDFAEEFDPGMYSENDFSVTCDCCGYNEVVRATTYPEYCPECGAAVVAETVYE